MECGSVLDGFNVFLMLDEMVLKLMKVKKMLEVVLNMFLKLNGNNGF